jgi:hypothetical protein
MTLLRTVEELLIPLGLVVRPVDYFTTSFALIILTWFVLTLDFPIMGSADEFTSQIKGEILSLAMADPAECDEIGIFVVRPIRINMVNLLA